MKPLLVKLRNPQKYLSFGVGTSGLGYTTGEETPYGLAMRVRHQVGSEPSLLDEKGTLMVPWQDVEYYFILDDSVGKPTVGFLPAE